MVLRSIILGVYEGNTSSLSLDEIMSRVVRVLKREGVVVNKEEVYSSLRKLRKENVLHLEWKLYHLNHRDKLYDY